MAMTVYDFAGQISMKNPDCELRMSWKRGIMAQGLFLISHAVALSLIAKHFPIIALELASAIGMTERAVRKIIAALTGMG